MAASIRREGATVADDRNSGFGWSREEHDRRQAALGLELSPGERLEWLERTMEEMGELLGRARSASGAEDGSGDR